MDRVLEQTTADNLLQTPKFRTSENFYDFPDPGKSLRLPLLSKDRSEEFSLDITRGSIQIKKISLQTRLKRGIILARLDLGGAPHRNPDGKEITCPHIHLYREGFDDKWAFPIQSIDFPNLISRKNCT